MSRKLIVAAGIGLILALAGLPSIVAWLDHIGLIPWARWVRVEYVTGTAMTIIVVLLILLPRDGHPSWPAGMAPSRCPVCEGRLSRAGRYCPTCGSRM